MLLTSCAVARLPTLMLTALVVPTVWLHTANRRSQITPGNATAVPVSDTACGLEAALSVSVIAPVSVPAPVGLNVTEIVQLAFSARLDPQVLVCA